MRIRMTVKQKMRKLFCSESLEGTLMILGVALGFCSGFAFGFVTFIVAVSTPIN